MKELCSLSKPNAVYHSRLADRVLRRRTRSTADVPSSFGWHPAEKKKELFHPLSRFIVAKPSERSKTVQGYLMWRADIEEDIKGNDEVVLYM